VVGAAVNRVCADGAAAALGPSPPPPVLLDRSTKEAQMAGNLSALYTTIAQRSIGRPLYMEDALGGAYGLSARQRSRVERAQRRARRVQPGGRRV
jgi:hypothetical protein